MSQKRGNSVGGKFTRHKCVKAIINEAIKKGFLTSDQNPYRFFKVKAAIGKRQFLSVSEVCKLIDLDIPEKNGFLNRVRDLFLFSCFTGLRYSDVMNLRWQDISPDYTYIKLNTTKTKKSLMVPLQPGARAIIEKYGKQIIKIPTGKTLPQMANQVINRELKILIEKANITKSISFHCARHSFASNLIEAKTNLLHVKDLLGHSKITETQIYAKSLESDLFGTMANLAALYARAV
jgi:site-specific recombinase XerD